MEEFERTKDVVVGDERYQLTRFTAREGNWIVMQFMKRGLLNVILSEGEKKFDTAALGLMVSMGLPELPEELFSSVQDKCFATVRKYVAVGDNSPVARPLVMQDGSRRWAEDEPTATTAMALLIASLTFNLEPFFAPGALKTLRQMLPDLTQFNAPTSPGSSSVRS